jgi:hypothetical protein
MSIRIVFVALFSAALLSSCSSETPSDVRTEVSRPLKEAVYLSYQLSPDKSAIRAKLNQAASVPNLNSDEQNKIRTVVAIVRSRVQNAAGGPAGNDISAPPDYSQYRVNTGFR